MPTPSSGLPSTVIPPLSEAGRAAVLGSSSSELPASLGCGVLGIFLSGVSIGILPGGDRDGQSAHLTYSIPTGMGEARNVLIASAADALIAIGGEFGTLSEIAFALRVGVSVVGLRTWELGKHGAPVDAFAVAEEPEDAVRRALDAARARLH